MTLEERWYSTADALPLHDVLIDWMQSDGRIVTGGKKIGNLWFLPDGVYVYYVPKMWRYHRSNR